MITAPTRVVVHGGDKTSGVSGAKNGSGRTPRGQCPRRCPVASSRGVQCGPCPRAMCASCGKAPRARAQQRRVCGRGQGGQATGARVLVRDSYQSACTRAPLGIDWQARLTGSQTLCEGATKKDELEALHRPPPHATPPLAAAGTACLGRRAVCCTPHPAQRRHGSSDPGGGPPRLGPTVRAEVAVPGQLWRTRKGEEVWWWAALSVTGPPDGTASTHGAKVWTMTPSNAVKRSLGFPSVCIFCQVLDASTNGRALLSEILYVSPQRKVYTTQTTDRKAEL